VVALPGRFIGSCPNRLNSRLRRKTGNFRPIGIHVCFGSKADVTLLNFDVRFTPESGHSPTRSGCLLRAINRHQQPIGELLEMQRHVQTQRLALPHQVKDGTVNGLT
jgi:hypothetical protein